MDNNPVITSMSVKTPNGRCLKEFFQNSIKGKSGVNKITHFPIPESMSRMAGCMYDFYPQTMDVKQASTEEDRAILLLVEAFRDILPNIATFDPNRSAIVISSAVAQITTMERLFYFRTEGGTKPFIPAAKKIKNRRDNPYLFSNIVGKAIEQLGVQSRSIVIPTGCAGGLDSLIYATHAIRSGKIDTAIVAATEAPITPLVVGAFSKIGATSTRNDNPQKASRPFDITRDGFVLGEGSAVIVLESMKHAINRGASMYASITGVGSVNNCTHMTDIPQDGLPIAKVCKKALADAGISPSQIDMINSHGSSTPQNDIAETRAYHKVFGKGIYDIPVTSLKSQIGHSLAASNLIEVVSSVQSIYYGVVPPTINIEEQDPKCNLDVVKKARNISIKRILKTSSGFSGIHSSLVLEKCS